MLSANFYNVTKKYYNIVHLFEVLSTYIDLMQEEPFTKIQTFNIEDVLKFFDTHLDTQVQQVEFKKLLLDLVIV
jgi:hypothetical protein